MGFCYSFNQYNRILLIIYLLILGGILLQIGHLRNFLILVVSSFRILRSDENIRPVPTNLWE